MKVGDKGIVLQDLWWAASTDGSGPRWTHENQPQSSPDIAFPDNQFEITGTGFPEGVDITMSNGMIWWFNKEDAEKYLSVNRADKVRHTLRRLR